MCWADSEFYTTSCLLAQFDNKLEILHTDGTLLQSPLKSNFQRCRTSNYRNWQKHQITRALCSVVNWSWHFFILKMSQIVWNFYCLDSLRFLPTNFVLNERIFGLLYLDCCSLWYTKTLSYEKLSLDNSPFKMWQRIFELVELFNCTLSRNWVD